MSKATLQNLGLLSAVFVAVYLVRKNIVQPYLAKRREEKNNSIK
tara:strand:- start:2814 stop:2945 length:132 start_codon:yes stop_codon:yes gene_type:complete